MRQVLGNRPKCLAPIGSRSFLEVVLDHLHAAGEDRVHLCLGEGADQVVAAMRDRRPNTVSWSVEATPLGVFGAVVAVLRPLAEPIAILYGDVFPAVAVSQLREVMTPDLDVVMTVFPADGIEPANVALDGLRVARYDKARSAGLTHVEAGLLLVRRKAIPMAEGALHETDVLPVLARAGRVGALDVGTPSLHVGDPRAYEHARAALGDRS